jgi:hypothetical protein
VIERDEMRKEGNTEESGMREKEREGVQGKI